MKREKDLRLVPNEAAEKVSPLVLDMTKFVNASQTLSVLNDERWEKLLLPLLVEHREAAVQRGLTVPSTMDGAIQAAEWRGGQQMAQRILNFLIMLRRCAAGTIEEARTTRPV